MMNRERALMLMSTAIDALSEYQNCDRDNKYWEELEEAEEYIYRNLRDGGEISKINTEKSLEEDIQDVFDRFTDVDGNLHPEIADPDSDKMLSLEKTLMNVLGSHPDECRFFSVAVEKIFETKNYITGFVSICYVDPVYNFPTHITEKWEVM